MAMTLTQDDLDAIIAAMNLTPPAVNVTYQAGVAVAAADASGNIPAVLADSVMHGGPSAQLTLLYFNADVIGSGVQQAMRNSMKLAPTAGAPAAGSVDAHLDDILEDTGTTLPAAIAVIDANVDELVEVDTSSTDATAAGSITRRRGDSWSISLTIGAITGYTSLWFTIKSSTDNLDSAAIVQIKLNASGLSDGLLYINGAAASNDALGSITVSDATTGAIVVALDETMTDDLTPGSYSYDVQTLISGAVTTPDSGTFTITADVTRSVL